MRWQTPPGFPFMGNDFLPEVFLFFGRKERKKVEEKERKEEESEREGGRKEEKRESLKQ